MKAIIIYASTHHGNTYKLVDAIAKKYDVAEIDAVTQHKADLSEYDFIGFASGIDFGKFYEPVEAFLRENLPENKKVFFLYTCAKDSAAFTKSIKEEARKKNSVIIGEYGCNGFNTYGPWKLIGGMNKNHPTTEEVEGAVRFFERLVNEAED